MGRLEGVKADAGSMGVIAQRVAGGETLLQICKAWHIPHGATLAWLMEDEGRFAVYRNALVMGGFAESDEAKELLDASTPETIAVDKERANIRRWRASKQASEFFGERVDVTLRRAPANEAALLAQLDALIAGSPGLLDALLERRAALARPVTQDPPAEPAHSEGA